MTHALTWIFVGIGIAAGAIFLWHIILAPWLKSEINIVVTGTAAELEALAEAIRGHVFAIRKRSLRK